MYFAKIKEISLRRVYIPRMEYGIGGGLEAMEV
jgi:hypothetical protein